MQHLKNSLKHREPGAPCHNCPPSRNGVASDGFMSSNLTGPQPSSDQSAQVFHHGSHLRAREQVCIHSPSTNPPPPQYPVIDMDGF
ncbi:hypothetical protein BO94DRAFT_119345 [Aspergillus sclerotioniger CBS 115572]|uniref:Uncharacterized protein n=1 Tax=Aspergillus sclerotioniger CBS 115572 TaxID=1450535 RepID=A0A317WD54_9EURO|nr:hypothetical protein BO94DRAFT_119345 [Aspergillus sclerotioniger CBS 115572]PWY83132.1 hypothetical protein BO94DRAFT_119345 [Aspergillus sclerotioniger CBS 115572]